MAFIPGSVANKVTSTVKTTGGFVPGSIANKIKTETKTTNGFVPGSIAAKFQGTARQEYDLNTIEGLRQMAIDKGLGDQVSNILESKPKLGVLQRLVAGVGAFGTANAVSVGKEKGFFAGATQYLKDIGQGLASAVTGTDYGNQMEKKTYSDLLAEGGIENNVAKYGIGFIGDVLLDPSTYFGGAIIKGILKGTKATAGVALQGISKVAPEFGSAITKSSELLKEAAGKTFKFGYGTTKTGVTGKSMADAALEHFNKLSDIEQKAVVEATQTWGTGTLTIPQAKEAVTKSLEMKLAQNSLGIGTDAAEKEVKKIFGSITDQKVADVLTLQNAKSKDLYVRAVMNKTFGTKLAPDVFDAVETLLKDKVGLIPAGGKISESAILAAQELMTPSLLKKLDTVSKPFEYYFPSLKRTDLEDFVGGVAKQAKIYPGSAGYLKQFRNLITDEELVKNPVMSYAKRAAEIEKDIAATKNLNDMVAEFGKPVKAFKNEQEALIAGYKPIYPKGTKIGFYKGEIDTAKAVLEQIQLQNFRQGGATLPQLLEQSMVKVGKAIQFAEESGLKVLKKGGRKSVGGSATLGGIAKSGVVNLKAFTSDVIAHELGHSFDTGLSKVINSKRIFQQELTNVTNFTKLGGSASYRASAVERFADFVDLYIHNPKKALEIAPEFTKEFEENILGQGKIAELVSNLADFFQKVDGLPNIKTALKELDGNNYLETAIRKAFPKKEFVGVRGIKPVGWLPKNDVDFLEGLVTPELTTFDKLAQATGYDAITALFKRSVTGLFAPFHVRNYISGMIQNFETLGVDALNPKNIAAGQKMAYKIATRGAIPKGEILVKGVKTSTGEVFDRFKKRFGSSSSYESDLKISDIGQSIFDTVKPKSPIGKVLETAGKYTISEKSPVFKVARSVGNFIETQQKATAYLTALNQGKSIEEALKLAATAGFDYRKLTAFESKVMRRIIPFYSFTKNNVALQLKTIGEHPERINQIVKFFQAGSGAIGGTELTAEQKKDLPAYIQNSLGLQWSDTPEGLKQFIYSLGSPIEAFTGLLEQNVILKGISMMNPLLKAPIEIGTGKDSFRMKDLKDVYDAKEYQSAPKFIKDMLDITEVDKPILVKDVMGKLVESGKTRKVYVADPVKLLIARSLFTSRGVSYLDQVFNGDYKDLITYMKLFSGIKPSAVDIEAVASIKERDQKRALQDLLLKRTGEVSSFNSVYQNK